MAGPRKCKGCGGAVKGHQVSFGKVGEQSANIRYNIHHSSPRKYSVWCGGSLLSSGTTFFIVVLGSTLCGVGVVYYHQV